MRWKNFILVPKGNGIQKHIKNKGRIGEVLQYRGVVSPSPSRSVEYTPPSILWIYIWSGTVNWCSVETPQKTINPFCQESHHLNGKISATVSLNLIRMTNFRHAIKKSFVSNTVPRNSKAFQCDRWNLCSEEPNQNVLVTQQVQIAHFQEDWKEMGF